MLNFKSRSCSVLFGLLIIWGALAPLTIHAAETPAAPGTIAWQPWTDDLFTKATREKKLVILDLEAVWCHWCHVMEEKTYHDPKVIQELKAHFIIVRVDQDSRPDISNRFEDFGWPATILFDSKGVVLARRSGYIEPAETLKMLQAFVADPTPGPSASDNTSIRYASTGSLTQKQRTELVKLIKDEYDTKTGGWKATHKFLDTNLAEYFLRAGHRGDKVAMKNFDFALRTQESIFDKTWGGFYQYSAESDWKHPHFEKIMSIQADNLRAYSIGLADLTKARRDASARIAAQIVSYVDSFLTSPDGTFYVSQDADVIPGEHAAKFFALGDKERRAIGIPKVDTHVYSRENGWMISSLADDFAATSDPKVLDRAVRAAQWILAHRKVGTLFSHDQVDKAGPYLGDNISMASAFLKLYSVTGDRKWLREADTLAESILTQFPTDETHPGLVTVATPKSSPPDNTSPAKPQFEENFKALRFYNLLSHYTGKKKYKASADSIFRFLASSNFQGGIYASAPILLAEDELANPPLHIVISGPKADLQAQALFRKAVAHPNTYKVVEWWDKSEGALPNPDDSYPQLSRPAAFVCAEHRCSFPAFKPDEIALRVRQLTGDGAVEK